MKGPYNKNPYFQARIFYYLSLKIWFVTFYKVFYYIQYINILNTFMKIGIIGPNIMPQLSANEIVERKNNLSRVAQIFASTNLEILLTPDKLSLMEFFGLEYLKYGGKKIYEVVPMDDDYQSHLNTDLGEIISCNKWPLQPSKFNMECDVIFCVGYGGMVMAEIGFSGYYNPKIIYIIKEFISVELPNDMGLQIKYIYINEVGTIVKNLINNQ